jgi:hypothetical protein
LSCAIFKRTEFDPMSTAAKVGMAGASQFTASWVTIWRKCGNRSVCEKRFLSQVDLHLGCNSGAIARSLR